MAPLLQTSLATVAGIAVAAVAIFAVERLGHSASVLDPFAVAIAGYLVGSFTGAVVAARLAASARLASRIVVGVLAGLAAINLFAFPHPVWFAPAAIAVFITAALVAPRLAGRRA